jgi:hypothetical protein
MGVAYRAYGMDGRGWLGDAGGNARAFGGFGGLVSAVCFGAGAAWDSRMFSAPPQHSEIFHGTMLYHMPGR